MIRLRQILVAASILGMLVTTAGAAQTCLVEVDGYDTYASVNAALAALPDREGHHLVISGVCQETVEIAGHRGLTIKGTGEAVLEPADDDPAGYPPTLTFRTCDEVRVSNLTVRGRPGEKSAVSLWYSRQVNFDRVTIERGGWLGLWSVSSVGIQLDKVLVRDSDVGIRVDGPSEVVLVGAWIPGDSGTARVENNWTGVLLNPGASFTLRGDAIVSSNSIGIRGHHASNFWVCCSEDIAYPRLEDNLLYGLLMIGGQVRAQAPLTLRGSGIWGAFFRGTQATLNNLVVEGNGSGSGGGGGVIALGGSVELSGGVVRANEGDGVALWDTAFARLFNLEIFGNAGHGVDVQSASLARVAGLAAQDNGGFDLRCSPNSHGRGDASGIDRLHCPGFNRSPDPVPGPMP